MAMIGETTKYLLRKDARLAVFHRNLLCVLMVVIAIAALQPDCLAQFAIRANVVQQGWFESWALQGRNEQYYREQVESQAQLEIENLKSVVPISELQEKKLKLALEGDLARFFRMVDEARFKTRNMQPVNEQVGEISRIISPIQQIVQKGILDETSLFHGVLDNMLTPEQSELWDKELARRQRLINKAIVQVQICALEKTMPLLSKQREALTNVVLERLEGKKVINQYRVYLVDYAMYTLPESKLKTFLDEKQVKFYRQKRSQVEGWKSMLEGQGAKFEDEVEEPAEPEEATEVEKEEAEDGAKKAPVQRNAGGLG
ncbi:MAG: hypothetical protein JNK90_11040 [Planctomycetaceae bacterium]|nr:hypothetical protein [Planctomycetaceae bacterium]MBN8602375.1 hypothetical protein [Planctomycetota bacterium]